ncbi:MAG: hypothetical protein ACI8UO_004877 [Verrucomicrobiales bacterium]|jgi:hypothetical protein
MISSRIFSLISLLLVTALAPVFAQTEDPAAPEIPGLTDAQREAIAAQIEALKSAAASNVVGRYGTAQQAFERASKDPKAAVELYKACVKEISFTRLDREDREFRAWEDSNEEKLKFEPYARGLQMQLQYLWMATRAAQAEDISTIFPDLTSYIGTIAQMTSPPHPVLNGSVAGTVFADVYELDNLLSRNEEKWELNPMNIGGIYEKTIYSYLRTNMPQNLNTAWDKRIETETRLTLLYIEFEEGMERFQERNSDKPGGVRNEVRAMANFVSGQYRRALTFEKERLPVLKWGQARDLYLFSNRAFGAKAMLDLIQANIGHDRMEDWIRELEQLVQVGNYSVEPAAAAPEVPEGARGAGDPPAAAP